MRSVTSWYGCGDDRALHSFPTRRSSDLPARRRSKISATRRSVSKGLARSSQSASATIRSKYAVRWSPVVGFTADRKSTRLNSSHVEISYAVFCLKKKKSETGDDARETRA